ncbi:hypothetical protein [Paenibacillus alkalitolerans]|uniref:hypothetical protein n=1 Tax=Paenibacillus alkalitolerans TaxID=2799335 RepID=UPI0018F2BECC|nr:hypothetical protein [Paenibacillus alkalitolerans]
MLWNIKTKHTREDGGTVALELESADQTFDVNVRWDGCMEIHVYTVTEEDRQLKDTFHTCDIGGFIESLKSLNAVCADYFNEGSYWERQ